jgi:hypothetical protein
MIQIALWSCVNFPSELTGIFIAKSTHIDGNVHAHLSYSASDLFVWKFDVFDEFISNLNERLFGPVGEPVQRCTVYKRRELSASYPQSLPNRTHT